MNYALDPKIGSLPLDSALLEISRRIAAKDAAVWIGGSEAPTRLGWVDLPERSRSLLPSLDALEAKSRSLGITRIVLSGMGGSSLAPEVISRTLKRDASRELVILDSTEPHFVDNRIGTALKETLFIVSSKSGTTIETSSHLSLIESRLIATGLEPRNHIVIVTDPGSPLVEYAESKGLQLMLGDPFVGGRFSALSAFGLTPAALIGVDPSILLDDASEMMGSIHELAVPIASYLAPHRFVYFADSKQALPGLADWIEQLIAESTGKYGKGILPISLEGSTSHLDLPIIDLSTIIDAPLGAHFILWEWVTALLGHILKVDPFDQPDVQATKTRTLEALNSPQSNNSVTSQSTLAAIRSQLQDELADREYLSVCAFLDPSRDNEITRLREILERHFEKPVAFGWGPRFLHSTGQFHKGGPKTGVFLSITMKSGDDLAIPGRRYGFQSLIRAQAEGDRQALIESGNKVISLQLQNQGELKELIELFE